MGHSYQYWLKKFKIDKNFGNCLESLKKKVYKNVCFEWFPFFFLESSDTVKKMSADLKHVGQ